jgi:polyphosphate kinase
MADSHDALTDALPTQGNGAPTRSTADVIPNPHVARPVPDEAALDHQALYFNRELSWLSFNWRVLYQAMDERTPLLERVRFLAITASNLDEFFRKRVGGLKRQVAAGVTKLSPDGRSPETQLELIGEAVRPMYDALGTTWREQIAPQLDDAMGLRVRNYSTLTPAQRQHLHDHFKANIFPVLTPLAVDPGRPFPFISNQSLSLAVILRHPTRGTEHFARVKVPRNRGRWLPLDEPLQFVPIEQVVAHNVHELFRGMTIKSVHAFRVTRNADVRRNEEEADDLTEMISERLRERRFAPVVRLEVERAMPNEVRRLLMRELSLDDEDVYVSDGLMGYADMMALANYHIPEERYSYAYRYSGWTPLVPTQLVHEGETKSQQDIFSIIREQDVLVHHPYDSFQASVQRFIEEAAHDPKVQAIKQTLYRTSEESPIVKALIDAAERGKQVAVLVEVKARFDEERNIEWGQKLEDSGVHVAYGLVGLKTHAKVALVVREEDDGLRTYGHISTGNYNATTARLYTDLGLLTCDPDIGYDLINLFHYLTGYAPEQHYRRLLVAPRNMREAFRQLIQNEVDFQKEHGTGHVIAKMNALDDLELIRALYRASQEGVQVDLIVRGHCRLRPGLEGISDSINVISIVGRFLEHDRIYYFRNGGNPKVYMGSADWQRNKLDDRVETVVPIGDARLEERLIEILHRALEDRRLAWELRPDGRYVQRQPAGPDEEVGFQELLMQKSRERAHAAEAPWDID